MKLFAALLIAVSLSGCSTPGCFIQSKVVEVASAAVVGTLQCQNAAAVKNSMDSLLSPLGLCQSQTGLIGSTVCPVVSRAVVDFLAKNAVPAEWQCSAVNAKAALQAALLTACMSIPVSK